MVAELDSPQRRAPRTATRTLRDIPGPRGLPIVGNALQLELTRVHQVFEEWVREYGPLVRYRVAGRNALLVADAALADPILRARPGSLRRANVERVFEEMGLAGVFSAEGAAWRPQRKLAMEALSLKNTRAFFPTLRIVAERLHGRLARSADGRVLDITDDLMRFTVDVTTTLAFGEDMNTLEDRGDVLQTHLAHVFPMIARRTFAVVPYWRYVRLPRDRRFDRAMRKIHRVAERMIASTRTRLTERSSDAPAKNFLEAMVLARDENGQPFTNETIIGNTLTMLLAGEDTTAHSLAWALHLLCERPDVVARAREEIDAALGDARTPPDFEAAARLPYVEGIAHESMRLRPVAPIIPLEAIEDMVVGDVAVPRGTWLSIVSRALATDERNFDDPTAFRPERWVGETTGAHVATASIPFGSGPRACPGRTLALVEMRVVLATILKSFDVERVGRASDVRELFAFAMTPLGLRLRLRPRATAD
jgi:cytochrome P450